MPSIGTKYNRCNNTLIAVVLDIQYSSLNYNLIHGAYSKDLPEI